MTGILELVGEIKVGTDTPPQVLETGASLFLLPAVTCGNFSGLWISSSMFFLGKSVLPIGSDTSDCSRRELSGGGGPLRCSQEPWDGAGVCSFLTLVLPGLIPPPQESTMLSLCSSVFVSFNSTKHFHLYGSNASLAQVLVFSPENPEGLQRRV